MLALAGKIFGGGLIGLILIASPIIDMVFGHSGDAYEIPNRLSTANDRKGQDFTQIAAAVRARTFFERAW